MLQPQIASRVTGPDAYTIKVGDTTTIDVAGHAVQVRVTAVRTFPGGVEIVGEAVNDG